MVFLETPVFTRQIRALVDDDEYRALQLRLMLLAYAKNEQDDLTAEQLKVLRTLVQQEFG